MNIVFFGSGRFAVKSLEALVSAGHNIALVVTQPDKPKGRRLNYLPTEVKVKAQELKLNTYQPQNPNSQEAVDYLQKFPADVFMVIAYGHILKNQVLGLPKLYPLNVHASLLPRYRGAAPINWAIINGEKETGISIIKMNERMDAGDILLQKKLAIEQDDTAQTLEEKLAILAARASLEAIDIIGKSSMKFIGQEGGQEGLPAGRQASFAPKLEKSHGLINWNNDALSIVNQIRGLIPWPGAFTYYNGRLVKIWSARVSENKDTAKAARILSISKKGIIIGCAKGAVEIRELQLEGGKRLTVEAFLAGHKLVVGDCFAPLK